MQATCWTECWEWAAAVALRRAATRRLPVRAVAATLLQQLTAAIRVLGLVWSTSGSASIGHRFHVRTCSIAAAIQVVTPVVTRVVTPAVQLRLLHRVAPTDQSLLIRRAATTAQSLLTHRVDATVQPLLLHVVLTLPTAVVVQLLILAAVHR
jgi:hypothetical protein